MRLTQTLTCNLRQELRTPKPHRAARGVKGLLAAHQWLVKNQSKGLLIGGLADKLWGCADALENSKDVDVLIFSGYRAPQKKFEKGIDWWIPEKKQVEYSAKNSERSQSEHIFFQNGYGAVLHFAISEFSKLRGECGLFIPSKTMQIAMRLSEAYSLSHFQISNDGLQDEINQKFPLFF